MRTSRVPAWCLLPLLVLALLVAPPTAHAGKEKDAPVDPAAGSPGPLVTEQLTAELVAESKSVQPGTSVLVGVRFKIQEHWHIYWENGGEYGQATTYRWGLPAGWSASPILWPLPTLEVVFGSAAYIYEGTFVLPVRLDVPADAPEGTVRVAVKPDWLVCSEQCIEAGDDVLALDLVVAKTAPEPSAHRPLFDAARALWPVALPAAANAEVKAVAGGMELVLGGEGPWSPPGASLYLFAKQVDNAGRGSINLVNTNAEQKARREERRVVLPLKYAAKRAAPPARLDGILAVEHEGKRVGFLLDLPVTPEATQAAPGTGPTLPPALPPAPPAPREPPAPVPALVVEEVPPAPAGEEPLAFPLAVLLALLGGVILNLMPCVLPVLSIKILGFVGQAQEDPVRVRRHGYAFGVGVIASFWVLAGLIQALKSGGEAVGWGFQLQHAPVNAVLAALMCAIGLNLFGVFEIGTGVMNIAGDAASKIHASGYGGSFWSGTLATAIATPCTAPFMAGAVGYAVSAPALESFGVFTALGIGMAAPYVLLTANPRLLKKVPRPGPWMETFKRLLAFPMFAVAAWLVGVVGKQTNLEGVKDLLFGLVVLSVGLWIYGHWAAPERSTRVRRIGQASALVVIGFAVLLGAWACAEKPPPIDAGLEGSDADAAVAPPGAEWHAWTPRLVQRYLKAGYVVFVDFTADWCQSCKFNEHTFLETDSVREAVKAHGVALLKGDFTSSDATILATLKSFGRAGVPLYVIYSPRQGAKPVALPTVITSAMVVKALREARAGLPPPPWPPGSVDGVPPSAPAAPSTAK